MSMRRPSILCSIPYCLRSVGLAITWMAALTACGSAAGGGGGVGTVGGKLDSACNEAYGEGCYSFNGQTSREKCTGGKWTLIEDCAQGMVCQEKITVAGQPARTTECKATVVAPGTDATTGSDGTANEDATTGSDGKTLSDADNPSDTKIGDIGGGDANSAILAALKCAQTSCASQWAACQQNSACLTVLSCFSTCTGDALSCATTCQNSGNDISASLLQCAQTACTVTSVCGDGKCTGDEATTCPGDCPTGPVCGNGICESGETPTSCSQDCPATKLCGNGMCDSGETPVTCLQDCPTSSCCIANGYKCGSPAACNGTCGVCGGNTVCTTSFTCASTGPVCGNGTCEPPETNASCAADCPAAKVCGDLTCSSGETSTSCPLDCPPTGCNNGICSTNETAKSCPQDCDPATKCMLANCEAQWVNCASDTACASILSCVAGCAAGNTTCAQTCYSNGTSNAQALVSNYSSCYSSAGCGTTTNCGNGTCDSGETNATCPADCPATVTDPGCTAKTTSGCGGCSCEATVCAGDPYCCNQDGSGAGKWDTTCVSECVSAGTTCP